jgi:hypothetical protein
MKRKLGMIGVPLLVLPKQGPRFRSIIEEKILKLQSATILQALYLYIKMYKRSRAHCEVLYEKIR